MLARASSAGAALGGGTEPAAPKGRSQGPVTQQGLVVGVTN